MRRFYRFRSALPSSRAGFGPILWACLGRWHELDCGERRLGAT